MEVIYGLIPGMILLGLGAVIGAVDGEPGARVALIAARLGRTRLIGNLEF